MEVEVTQARTLTVKDGALQVTRVVQRGVVRIIRMTVERSVIAYLQIQMCPGRGVGGGVV